MHPRAAALAALLFAALAALSTPPALAAPTPGPTPAGVAGGVTGPGTSVGDGRVTFGVTPANARTSDSRPFLAFGLSPASDVVDHIAVFNQSNDPLRLTIYGADAVNGADGGLDLVKRADRNKDLGSWVTVGEEALTPGLVTRDAQSQTVVTVPPQSRERGVGRVIVPVRISVPGDATPGDHVGGIAVSLITLGKNTKSQNIELEQRVVVRTYVQVSGALAPSLAVKLLSADYEGGGGLGLKGKLHVTYRITNTGNVRIGASSRVRVRGPFGLAERTSSGPGLIELVPGGSGDVVADIGGVPPTVLTWATVTVEATVAPGGKKYDVAPATASTRVWAITWQELLLVAFLLGGTAWRLIRRRRVGHAGTRTSPLTPAVTKAMPRRPARGKHVAGRH